MAIKNHSELELEQLAKAIEQPKRRFSSLWERELATSLHKDHPGAVEGNHIDLNACANSMNQASGSKRVSPNVLASANLDLPGVAEALDETTKSRRGANLYKAQTPSEVQARSNCAKHCGNRQGRTSCAWCHGEGHAQKTARLSGVNKNQARNIMGLE